MVAALGEDMVPVLSKTTVSIAAICSIADVFLIYSLFLSNMLNAAESVKGELNANAQGQAIIKTAVKAPHAFEESPPISQKTQAAKAILINATVKYLLIKSIKVSNFFSCTLKLSLFHSFVR